MIVISDAGHERWPLACSQEVRHHRLIVDGLLHLVADRIERFEVSLHVLIDLENRRNVAASVAVVRRGPNSDQVFVLEPEFVAVHDKLMSACHEAQIVDLQELRGHLAAEVPAGTSRRHLPCVSVVVRIGPHEVAEWAFVRNFHHAIYKSDLVDRFDLGRKATVNAKHLVLNNSAHGQMIEDLHAVLPRISVAILARRLFVETIEGRCLARLMITPQQCDVARVPDL